MSFYFRRQVALVTGAASGIGLATARGFAAAGAATALVDVDADALQAAANELTSAGHKSIAIRCNVADENDVAAMVQQTISTFGRLDVAFNNAGSHAAVAETADALAEDFDRVIAINLRGIWNCMKHELRHMRERGSGMIVNCSSQSGLVGTAGLGAYTVSKHGVVGLTKSAALEYASRGIRINAICPGSTATPMVQNGLANEPETMKAVMREIPLGRLGKAEEIASAVLWLCSPGAAFMIGQTIVPDGGYTAK
ncbi:MAG: SDR family oxidoreductase [Acidobacteriaceae bacterium]|nr:SDR family oxidoreductase [Acidobacteriaceae bacterium]